MRGLVLSLVLLTAGCGYHPGEYTVVKVRKDGDGCVAQSARYAFGCDCDTQVGDVFIVEVRRER